MRINRPLIYSYHVVRLTDIKHIRACVPVSRKHIFAEYSKMLSFLLDSYDMSVFFADKLSATVLGYCPYDGKFYPLHNFDPDIKFISTPLTSKRFMDKQVIDNKW
jgi:hypothetical protein